MTRGARVQRVVAHPGSGERRPRSVIDVLRLSTEYLAAHGSASPRLDAELLLAEALGLRRIDLYLRHDQPVREPELSAVRELVRRRAAGEPIAYITGTREFYNRSFDVGPAVLIPRPETETLVELALHPLRELAGGAVDRSRPPVVADLGTGSGCIAVTLAAELPWLPVVAVDVSEPALEVARTNAVRHGVADRITLLHGDWAAPLSEPADVVVSNPPYVTPAELDTAAPNVREFEPRLALDGGDDGLSAYRALLESLSGRIGSGGRLLLEVDPHRAAGVGKLVVAGFPGAERKYHQDLTRRVRVLEARLP